MARRPQTAPRKTASQKRARSTVDALIEATARLLIQEGYDRTSTNKIAALAGVSIGSLYQYFPSKEALVAAVVERHTQELSQLVLSAFLRVSESPIEVGIRELVVAGINGHSVDPALHRILAEEAPRIGPLEGIDTVQRNGRALVRGYLETHRSEVNVADLDLAAFILVTTIEALTHSAVLHRPEVLADGKAGEFADEVTDLCSGICERPQRRPWASLSGCGTTRTTNEIPKSEKADKARRDAGGDSGPLPQRASSACYRLQLASVCLGSIYAPAFSPQRMLKRRRRPTKTTLCGARRGAIRR